MSREAPYEEMDVPATIAGPNDYLSDVGLARFSMKPEIACRGGAWTS